MNAAKRPSKPSVAKQSKHKSRPAKPPIKPRPPVATTGAGLFVGKNHLLIQMEIRTLTELGIVDRAVRYNEFPNVEQVLELGAF
jgi:hypothetical protein